MPWKLNWNQISQIMFQIRQRFRRRQRLAYGSNRRALARHRRLLERPSLSVGFNRRKGECAERNGGKGLRDACGFPCGHVGMMRLLFHKGAALPLRLSRNSSKARATQIPRG